MERENNPMRLKTTFTPKENISDIADQLRAEKNPQERCALKSLLRQEEDRYGYYSEQLEIAHRHILDGRSRIIRQEGIIADLRGNGSDTRKAEEVLHNLEELYEMFLVFYARIVREVEARRP